LPFKYSELIFVAGGRDNTYNFCKSLSFDNFVKVITLKQNPDDFKAGALIKGIKHAKGDYIILIDADTLVASNLVLEIVKSLEKSDAVNCDYYPMLQKGFWYNFYIINKLIWAKNYTNLSNLFGGATISMKKSLINEIGVEKLFTDLSTAGVDYYLSLVLKKFNKRLGFVKNARLITPRPNNIKDFSKDHSRWFDAFFQIHQADIRFVIRTLILNTLYSLVPLFLLFLNIAKIRKITHKKYKKVKYLFILFLVDYLRTILRIKACIKLLAHRIKSLNHFKGSRYLTIL